MINERLQLKRRQRLLLLSSSPANRSIDEISNEEFKSKNIKSSHLIDERELNTNHHQKHQNQNHNLVSISKSSCQHQLQALQRLLPPANNIDKMSEINNLNTNPDQSKENGRERFVISRYKLRKMTLKTASRMSRKIIINNKNSTPTTSSNNKKHFLLTNYLLGPILISLIVFVSVNSSHEFVKATNKLARERAPSSTSMILANLETVDSSNLMKNAELDLSRSQRLQRDTTTSSNEPNNQLATTCGYPGSPAHASVTFNTSHVVAGTAASYACDNGYELLGPPRRICQANGTWSPIGIPFCVLNVGLGKAAMQSSTAGHGSAQKAVDGSTSTYFQSSTCTMTDVEQSPWWYVNLLEPYLVQIVRIDFGTACCANRQKAMIAVRVGNNRPDLGNNPLCNRYHGFIEEGKPLFLPCTRPAPGAFVSIHLESPSGSSLSICETFIYTDHALSIEQCPSFRDQPLGSTATYNGKCYLFHNNQALNFDGARKYCEHKGGTLVDETSPALQGFLSWELYRRHRLDQMNGQYWLGAVRDTRNAHNWKWINGKDVQISFWNSLTSQSNNCSRFDGSKGWLWTDADCSANYNFICQYRPLSCGKPEKPTNSTLITKNVDNGTIIEYQCAPGSLLMGPKTRACLPTGFFSEFAPKCKYLDCQFPAMIANGGYKLLNGTTSYQSIVNYYCNEGYQLYNKATLTCDVDERWNGPPPRCEPLLCPAPVAPANGHVTITSNITIPGTLATYDCRSGYELVGDRLLTCLNSGSWDYSFPYCREKRQAPVPTSGAPPLPPAVPAGRGPQRLMPAATGSMTNQKPAISSSIQFPSQPAFSPTRIVTPPSPPSIASGASQSQPQATGGIVVASSGSTQATPVTAASLAPSSTASPPPPPPQQQQRQQSSTEAPPPSASLNGLAGQFAAAAAANGAAHASSDSVVIPSMPAIEQPNRKASNVNQFVVVPPPQAPQPPTQQLPPSAVEPAKFRGNSNRDQFAGISGSSSTTVATSSTTRMQPTMTSTTNSAQSSTNKFSFTGQPSSSSSSSSPASPFDSTPLATTNSISFGSHSPSSPNPTTVTSSTPSSMNQFSTSTLGATILPHNHLSSSASVNGPNVLGSFNPIRSHNSLASAKYSLDGIIAVAIFGGFIFLGAIITIIVIIIRRRQSSHSSSIDAQTISTYDSNGAEHNGLYRNYQQAWENLRFARPSSQPKSSGGGGAVVGPHAAAPVVNLKNLNPASAMIHHMHHPAHHSHLHGHHNMAMTHGSSSGSSQSSSSLGGTKGAGSGGEISANDGPLLRHSHHNISSLGHSHHHHHHHRRSHHLDSDHHHHHHHHHRHLSHGADNEDVTSQDDQGVLSSDEANYHHASQHMATSEGFRDSNELTINADTHVMSSQQAGGAGGAARRRIYNSSNNPSASAGQRVSANLSIGSHNNDHHHHHHHHPSSSSSQHQRLVSSSTPSESTRSSRASPPSDDHSLDRLAYGNSWHQAGPANGNQQVASGAQQQQHQQQHQHHHQDISNHSAGGSSSILGAAGGGRSNNAPGNNNMRY